ncbi:MAG: hypothetical protein H0T47_09240 [Planctomycetaceae bacterium]|nr:hypothetical protein [Planctomycetaceae bacterium]
MLFVKRKRILTIDSGQNDSENNRVRRHAGPRLCESFQAHREHTWNHVGSSLFRWRAERWHQVSEIDLPDGAA